MPPRLPTTEHINRPRSQGFHARIGDLYVRLAPSAEGYQMNVIAPESEPPRFDTAQTPEEFVRVDGQSFARSDFTGGEGLARAHRRNAEEGDVRRFWDSSNVRAPIADPGTPLYLDMARQWNEIATGLTDIFAVVTVPNTERVVLVGTTGWEAYEGLEDTVGPTLAGSGALVGAVGAAALGNTIYVVDGTANVVEIIDDNDGTFSTGTFNAVGGNWNQIWAAKNRLFLNVSPGNSLHEYQPSNPPVAITAERLIEAPYEWTSIVDAGAYVAAGATDGRVYFFSPDETGALVLRTSTPFPQDERIVDMAYNQGVLMVATEELVWLDGAGTSSTGRLYEARIADVLSNIKLIKRFDNIAGPVPGNFVTTRDSVFFTTRDGNQLEVWRVLLPTLGLFREDSITSPDAANPVGFANPGQNGVVVQPSRMFLEKANRATERPAWLILPAADFYTAEPKAWREIRLALGDMPNGGEVQVLATINYEALNDWQHPDWQTVRVVSSDQTDVRVPLTDFFGRYLLVQVRLKRGTDLQSPQLVSLSVVGRTDDEDVLQLRLPVIVSDRIERPNRKPVRSNGYGELLRQALIDVKGKTLDVELFRPAVQMQGTVTAVGSVVRMLNRRGHPVDVAEVLVKGNREIGESQALVGGTESLGVGLLGVEPILGGVTNG